MPHTTHGKDDFAGRKVAVLGETFEPGTPESRGAGDGQGWRAHIGTREEMIRYLKSGERYWYSSDWYGSEKRR